MNTESADLTSESAPADDPETQARQELDKLLDDYPTRDDTESEESVEWRWQPKFSAAADQADSSPEEALAHEEEAREELDKLLYDSSVTNEMSDEELFEGGMKKVTAWVRDGLPSGNARRIQKSRARSAAGDGDRAARKQLNLTAPMDLESRQLLKTISSSLLDGEITPRELKVALAPFILSFSDDASG